MSHIRPTTMLVATATMLALGCGNGGTTGGEAKKGGVDGATAQDADGATTADSGATDSGQADAGPVDTGAVDTGPVDTGPSGPACHPTNPAKGPCPAGQHCVWSSDVLVCEADGEHAAGEDCEDGKDCKIGICVKSDSGKSTCAPHCLGNLDCDSNRCNNLESSKGKVCDMGEPPPAQCNPFTHNCDGAGQACYASTGGFVCKMAGKVEAGSPCPADNSCKKGLICVGKTASGGVCRQTCNQVKGTEPSCDVGVKCTPFEGSEFVGFCQE